jgi:hypothetical protein
LALALGIGAAVTGGVGIASADGSTDNTAGGSTAQSAPASSAGADAAEAPSGTESPFAGSTDSESPDTGSTDVKTRPQGSSNVPRMQLGNGRGAAPGAKRSAVVGPGSLPELFSSIPQKLAAALLPHTSDGTNAPPTKPTPHTPRVRSDTATATSADRTPTPTGSTVDVAEDQSELTGRLSGPAANLDDIRSLRVVPSVALKPVTAPATATAVSLAAAQPTVAVQITPTQSRMAPANPIAMAVTNVLSALGFAPSASTSGDTPTAPLPLVQAALQLVHREIERLTLSLQHIWPTAPSTSIPTNAVPAISPGVPAATDEASTVYGDIGKWMLQSNGKIANYGGLPYGGRTVLEPVNVIIVDPTSSSAAESARKLNAAMYWSGFPAQLFHSTGFKGIIDDVTYGQQPKGLLLGFSDNFFLFPNNHGRIFGPDPVETSTGYVWSGAFSTEQFVIYDFLPRHAYVSSNRARTALAKRLVASGRATYGGMVPLDNSYNTATTTTGDHDGYAVVIVLK